MVGCHCHIKKPKADVAKKNALKKANFMQKKAPINILLYLIEALKI